LEHVLVVALATYFTGDVTVAPGAGVLTVTVANVGEAKARREKRMKESIFMVPPLQIVE
jgi:hypothetical protein